MNNYRTYIYIIICATLGAIAGWVLPGLEVGVGIALGAGVGVAVASAAPRTRTPKVRGDGDPNR